MSKIIPHGIQGPAVVSAHSLVAKGDPAGGKFQRLLMVDQLIKVLAV